MPIVEPVLLVPDLMAGVFVSAEEVSENGLVVVEMGTHVISQDLEAMSLYQVLVPGLEERAPVFPPLTSIHQTSPGGLICQYWKLHDVT